MVAITKHIGKMKDGGTRIAIVFRQVPDEPENALVVSTDNLPMLYHDAFINLIDSPEGQEANELQEILSRRQFPDGTNMLNQLHKGGYLIKVKTEDVNVMPRPNNTITLDKLNAEIAKINPKQNVTAEATDVDITKAEASRLLAEANSLEEQAKTVRENAYAMDENLRPKRGRPSKKAE